MHMRRDQEVGTCMHIDVSECVSRWGKNLHVYHYISIMKCDQVFT